MGYLNRCSAAVTDNSLEGAFGAVKQSKRRMLERPRDNFPLTLMANVFTLNGSNTVHSRRNFMKATVLIISVLFLSLTTAAPSTGTPTVVPSPTPASTFVAPSTPTSQPVPDVPAKSNAPPPVSSVGSVGPKGAVVLTPEKAKPVTVAKFQKPPVIDGNLNGAEWQAASVLKDFYQIDPGDNSAPSKPTEVLIGYDAKFLYVAFRAYDEPDKIRSTLANRHNIFSDDYVGFYLDTFNDQRRAFEIFFNPLGIQGDGVITEGRGEDFRSEERRVGKE